MHRNTINPCSPLEGGIRPSVTGGKLVSPVEERTLRAERAVSGEGGI